MLTLLRECATPEAELAVEGSGNGSGHGWLHALPPATPALLQVAPRLLECHRALQLATLCTLSLRPCVHSACDPVQVALRLVDGELVFQPTLDELR